MVDFMSLEAARSIKVRAAIWGLSLVASLFFHGGAIAFFMHTSGVNIEEQEPQAAIMVELAFAVTTPEPSNDINIAKISDGANEDSDEEGAINSKDKPTEEQNNKSLELEKASEMPEEPQVDQSHSLPVEEKNDDNVIVAEVKQKPEKQRVSKKTPDKDIKKSVQKPEAKTKMAAPKKFKDASITSRASVLGQKGDRFAAPAEGTATVGMGRVQTWQGRVRAYLEKRKAFLESRVARHKHGIVGIRFGVDDGGRIMSVQLIRSSGDKELDELARQVVERAKSVPKPPPGVAPISLTISWKFN